MVSAKLMALLLIIFILAVILLKIGQRLIKYWCARGYVNINKLQPPPTTLAPQLLLTDHYYLHEGVLQVKFQHENGTCVELELNEAAKQKHLIQKLSPLSAYWLGYLLGSEQKDDIKLKN